MYYPVMVDGALFSIGDPHISQGDGELSGTAIEASLNVLFQVFVRKDFNFPSPHVAMRKASVDMLKLLTDHQDLRRNDAYSLMSVACDFGVTQVVDGRQGVHVRIPRGIFPPENEGSV
jgi:acetamidase/formamidase